MLRLIFSLKLLFIVLFCQLCNAEIVKVATYNIRDFSDMFDQYALPSSQRDSTEYERDREDLYEIARVITLPGFEPDILCIQEGPSQEMLERFNKEYLKGKYQFVQVFKGNTSGQNLAIMAGKDYEAVATDLYYQEKDPADSTGKKLLFSRGPAFITFTTPLKNTLVIGVTHTRSKVNDDLEITLRRGRQISRIREICEKYIDSGQEFVAVLGDFNDSFGKDENEDNAGLDTLAEALAGKKLLECLTKKLQEEGKYSYHCQLKSKRYRGFLDHIFASIPLSRRASEVKVIDDPIADVASDHWPVMATFNLPDN